jgi:polysaccharide deacetylase family protein (PEP-CTERM system associated)
MKNILSIDVEEWFHPEAVQHLFPADSWDERESRVEENVEKLLALFDTQNSKATFFVLGWTARKFPQLIKKIAAAGHEVATHGNSHRMVTKLTPKEFREDLAESISIIQEISGEKVLGFRAPTFSLVKETQWAWEIMLELGIEYDSSVYPIWHDRYGIPDAPRHPYIALEKESRKLIEFPMPTLKIGNKNFPFGGGGYLRIFPLSFTKYAIKKFNKEGLPAIIYAHPWEFDTGQPRLKLGTIQTLRHYYNINSNLKKLETLLTHFEWTSFKDLMAQDNFTQNFR